MLAMTIGCTGGGAVIAPGVVVPGSQAPAVVGGAIGDVSAGLASGSGAAGGNSNTGQSQYLLAKLMQPILSEDELAEIARERAIRSDRQINFFSFYAMNVNS